MINGKADWSRYNATVVGASRVIPNPRLGCFDDSQPTYRVVSFAADREYGPEEGWQTVHRSTKMRRQKNRWQGSN